MSRVHGSSLLVAGTCIGAGLLALPAKSALLGFPGSVALLIMCWFASLMIGLIVLEVNMSLPEGTNYIGMVHHTLGKEAEVFTWFSYLCMLYALLTAYFAGGSGIFIDAWQFVFDTPLGTTSALLLWALMFVPFIMMGAKPSDLLNRPLMIGLVVVYSLLMTFATKHIQTGNYVFGEFKYFLPALTITLTSFGFHIIVPSLRRYLNSDIAGIRKSMIIGTTIPLLIYVWLNYTIFGIIPMQGDNSLVTILQSGHPGPMIADAIAVQTGEPWLAHCERFLAFFAISTSFIGVGLSLWDFLADGLRAKESKQSKLLLTLLTFVPPMGIAVLYPHGFVVALEYAGLINAMLFGVFPVVMVFSLRQKKVALPYQVKGGTPLLILLLVFYVGVVVLELLKRYEMIPGAGVLY